MSKRFALSFVLASCLQLACAGCGGEQLSVGELRCVGDLECSHEVTPLDPAALTSNLGAGPVEEPELAWDWFVPLECGDEGCGADQLLVHDDGSTTVLFSRAFAQGGQIVGRHLLGRFGPAGESLGTAETPGGRVVLARDAGDQAYAASNPPTAEQASIAVQVARVETSGRMTPLFLDDDGRSLGGLAVDDGGFWISGRFDSGPDAPIEVARYTPEGELVYRQSGLRKRLDAFAGADEPDPFLRLSLARGRDGAVFAVTQDPDSGNAGLAMLDAHGDVRWHLDTWLRSDALLQVDSRGWPVLAGQLTLENASTVAGVLLDGYTLLKLDPDDPNSGASRMAVRAREEYYLPVPFALALDRDDNVYVATTVGTVTEREVVIERFSPDLAERQTLHIPSIPQSADGEPPVGALGALARPALQGIVDMGIAPDGRIVVLAQTIMLAFDGDLVATAALGALR